MEQQKQAPAQALFSVQAIREHQQGLPGPLRYSERALAEAAHPKNVGRLPGADAYGAFRGGCGDTMEIYLQLDAGKIVKATFMTSGQTSAIAAGSVLTTMVQGLSLEEAGKIQAGDVIQALGGLPEAKVHCAKLMVTALREAIANWRVREHQAQQNQR
ncbi:MAG: iron-sulfur cluster assembly scaffold protein [Thermoflexales bacterium]|nr:iron-sulfur cluster assembly scaffold protein [Thermoflexales bacterium]